MAGWLRARLPGWGSGASFAVLAASLLLLLVIIGGGPVAQARDWAAGTTCRLTGYACQQPGRVLLGSVEIYTRERLVDDRLEHVNWLNRQLRALDEAGTPEFQGLVVRTRQQRNLGNAAAAPAGEAAPEEIREATVARYRQMSYFRELLRAERTRATLDDRHDIEGNTILQMVFDATVIPPRDRRGFALVAVSVGRAEDPAPANHGAAATQPPLTEGDARRLYDDWLVTLEPELELMVQQRAQGLMRLAEPIGQLSDVRPLLAARLCAVLPASGREAQASGEGREQDCLRALLGGHRAPGGSDDVNRWLGGAEGSLPDLIRAARERFEEISERVYAEQRDRIVRQELAPLAPRLGVELAELARRLPSFAALASLCRPRSELVGLLPSQPVPVLRPAELARLGPAAGQFAAAAGTLELPCPPLFRLREEALLLHQLAEGVEAGRLSLTSETWPRAASAFCFEFDHGFVPDRMRELLKEQACTGEFSVRTRVTEADLACAAAHLRRMELSRPRAYAEPGNNAQIGEMPLSHFIQLRIVRGGQGYCRLRAEARTAGPSGGEPGWKRLQEALRGVTYDLYAYGLAPRNATQRIESRVEDGIALNLLLGAGAARAPATQGVVASIAQRFAGAQDQPFVVGFGSDGGPQGRAVFGWILSPRRTGADADTHTLETHTLSAVLSVPSWWRRAGLTVHECWSTAEALPELMARLRHVAHDGGPHGDRTQGAAGAHPLAGCSAARTIQPRLPGGEADLTRALRIEVIRTPYLKRNENEQYVARVGEPASFRIGGGRLWRSTSVTLGGQIAERIRILPNMMGIVAEFSCVQPPSILAPRAAGMPPGGAPYPVPLQVWTSEGVVEEPLIVLVQPGQADRSCPARGG